MPILSRNQGIPRTGEYPGWQRLCRLRNSITRGPKSRRRVATGHSVEDRADAVGIGGFAAASLSIPRMDGIPSQYRMSADEVVMSDICTELMASGVLIESDYRQDLGIELSLRAGLDRWIHSVAGKPDARVIRRLEFGLRDDVERDGTPGLWEEEEAFRDQWRNLRGAAFEDRPICEFYLCATRDIEWATVGKAVLQIERLCRGAGYAVLRTLNRAISITVGGATPAWAYEWLYEMDSGLTEEEEEDEYAQNGIVHFSALERVLPRETYNFELVNLDMLDEALQNPKIVGKKRRAIDAAIALRDMRDDTHDLTALDDLPLMGLMSVHPLAVNWSQAADLERIVDDHQNYIMEIENGTDCVFGACFQTGLAPDHPGSIVQAVKRLELCLAILSRISTIIDCLDESRRPRQDSAARPLIEVLV